MRKPRKTKPAPAPEPAQDTLLHLLIDDPALGPTRHTIRTRGWVYNPNTTLHNGVVLDKRLGPIPAEQEIPATGLDLAQIPELVATLAAALETDISAVCFLRGTPDPTSVTPDLFAEDD